MRIGPLELFEVEAEAFRIMTGYLAPGKSQSPEANTPSELREQAWNDWVGKHRPVLVAYAVAIKSILGDEQ